MTPDTTGPTHDCVEREIAAAPAGIFAVLADPRRHQEIDGVRMIRHDLDAGPVTAEGQVFRMAMTRYMSRTETEDYEVDNRVVEVEPDRRIAWRPALVGAQTSDPAAAGIAAGEFGWLWRFELEPLGPGRTRVTQTFDWAQTPQSTLDALGLPMPSIPRARRERTLEKLAALVEDA